MTVNGKYNLVGFINKRDTTLMTAVSRLIEGCQAWIERKYEDGWSIWFCTVQYNHLRQAKAGSIDSMQNEVQRIYSQLLTNIIRNPRKVASDQLPMLIGAPDMPVFKYKPTTRLADMLPNNGIHYHFVLLVPSNNRLKITLDQHVIENMQIYLGNQRKVSKFDVQTFLPMPGKSIADYLLKHIKRNTFTSDDILLLPRSRSELISPEQDRLRAPSAARTAVRILKPTRSEQRQVGKRKNRRTMDAWPVYSAVIDDHTAPQEDPFPRATRFADQC